MSMIKEDRGAGPRARVATFVAVVLLATLPVPAGAEPGAEFDAVPPIQTTAQFESLVSRWTELSWSVRDVPEDDVRDRRGRNVQEYYELLVFNAGNEQALEQLKARAAEREAAGDAAGLIDGRLPP